MPTPRLRSVVACLVVALVLGAACSQQDEDRGDSSRSTGASRPALGALAAGCRGSSPSPAVAPVAFAAAGRAWAASADGVRVWCLFEVSNPGPFLWGPRGDRVALGGLEVRGVGAPIGRPPLSIAPLALAWTGPTGNALAFVPPGGLNLEMAELGSTQLRELTPLRGASYRTVAAHPSGRALAFAVDQGASSEVWLSSADGTGAVRVDGVRRPGKAGVLAFSVTGKALYYAVRLPDGGRRVDVWSLVEARRLAPAWTGRRDVQAIVPRRDLAGGELAIDVGGACGDRQALLTELGGSGRPLLPKATRPTSVVGWLDARQVLVAEGGCDGPADLWAVDTGGRAPVLLARGVSRAGVRRPDRRPLPAPPDLAVLAREVG